MSEDTKKTDLGMANELFAFLQGNVPEGYKIPRGHKPKLTPDQASTVIWYLGNLYWQVPDHIDRCDVCGDLFDRHCEGDVLDYGRPPIFFCDSCINTDAYAKKSKSDPDREKSK